MGSIQRTIADVMTERTWPQLGPAASVADALAIMKRTGIDCVLVVDQGALAGVFTSRDFLNRVAGQRLPAIIRLDEVMTATPEALKLHDCVTYAINRMALRNIRNVPIVDDARRPVGLLRVWDVIAHLAEVFEEIAAAPGERPADDVYVDLGGG